MTFGRLVVVALIAQSTLVGAETIGCVTTEWKLRDGPGKADIEISDISASMGDGSRRPTGAESNEKTSP